MAAAGDGVTHQANHDAVPRGGFFQLRYSDFLNPTPTSWVSEFGATAPQVISAILSQLRQVRRVSKQRKREGGKERGRERNVEIVSELSELNFFLLLPLPWNDSQLRHAGVGLESELSMKVGVKPWNGLLKYSRRRFCTLERTTGDRIRRRRRPHWGCTTEETSSHQCLRQKPSLEGCGGSHSGSRMKLDLGAEDVDGCVQVWTPE